jgi:CBS domain-containing protein
MNVRRVLANKGVNVITARPEQSIREVISLLAQYNIGALIVVDEGECPVGIISERDIVRGAAKNEKLFDQPVSELMTQNVLFACPDDDLTAVANTMTEKRFRHMPIMEDDKLVGIISIGDVVKVERDQYQGEVAMLHTYIFNKRP